MTIYTATDLGATAFRLQMGSPVNRPPDESDRADQINRLRHILLGSPEEIRQAIHQLHVLNYVEPMLWSPIMAVGERLIITPEQGEAMSLLRR